MKTEIVANKEVGLKLSQKLVILGYFMVVFVIGGLVLWGTYNKKLASSKETASTRIENVFVDVNGDGFVDLIVLGDVIFNTGNQDMSFPEQPEK